ncbi:hypothetical protein GNX71_18650 [Variovorax sp. RKNM96]|uniref:hypothetical protein n=1 Tax=Variovorax sp. RKNM96 TaxID=2681552 RepID=UPI00197E3FF8|nr:hypothetical protein [Variovorax sp. RKNM96]QSI31488.1 hypothetical protein GNX71_18650 [Variovorax sp. RKNM96]
MTHAIRNTATTQLIATYGLLKDRAAADCAYMNETELKYGRAAIFETTEHVPETAHSHHEKVIDHVL